MLGIRDVRTSNQGVIKTRKAPIIWNPLQIVGCQFASAPFLLDASVYSGPLCRVRRVIAGDEVDVAKFQQNTLNYKLQGQGSWTDGTGETFYSPKKYDLSGNGRDISQAIASYQPFTLLNILNGWPVSDWDGANDILNAASPYNPSGNTAGTLIAVIKADGADAGKQVGGFTETTSFNGFSLQTNNTSGEGLTPLFSNGAWGNSSVDIDSAYISVFTVFNGNLTGVERGKLYVNNIEKIVTYSVAPPAAIQPCVNFSEGGLNNTFNRRFNGKTVFFAYYSTALTEIDRNNMQNWITEKFGV